MPEFKTKPYAHQLEALELSKDRTEYALLLEQGLGKSKIAIDTFAHLARQNRVHALLIVAPNGVHSNWVQNEIPAHMPDDIPYVSLEWSSKKTLTKKFREAWKAMAAARFSVLCVNVEALSTGKKAKDACNWLLRERRTLMVVDESSRIKTPGSKRTKAVITMGKKAPYKRIMTGTPVTQSPFDCYAQFRFLDPQILGFTSFYTFKHTYGVWQKEFTATGQYEALVRHVRLDDLAKKIAPHSYRKTKEECLDLPPKIYQSIIVELTPAQRALYETILEEGELVIPEEGLHLLAPLQITRLLRAQQIIGGFLPRQYIPGFDGGSPTGPIDITSLDDAVGPIEGTNPKLKALLEALENDYPGKAIIWARFRHEIDMIVKALRGKLEGQTVELHGGVTAKQRTKNVTAFQDPDSSVRFLVGQQASGVGITLHAAKSVFYFSNDFSYEHRYQSEDRAHRIGLRHAISIVNLEAADTIDAKIRGVLLKSARLADTITGDSRRKVVS